ncbi:MAG: hypothetical protein ACYC0N_00590 [Carboxydocellales bacterium]
MKIGRKLYFDRGTGQIMTDTGEREGAVIETTIEQDFAAFPGLAGRTPEDTGVKELAFGERREEISNMGSWEVDPATEDLIIYPRPPEPIE